MKIKYAEYLLTAVKSSQYPEIVRPAVTFCGRSNVGKSSLINGLVNRRGLARTSQQPGKTRTINFYDIDKAWYLVDLPGYGYARVSKSERNSWQGMIDEYIQGYAGDNLYFQLVDIRHEPSAQDKQMWSWLQASGVKCQLIATKADKISKGARDKHLSVICKALDVKRKDIRIFSSITKEGKEEILDVIGEFLGVEPEVKPEIKAEIKLEVKPVEKDEVELVVQSELGEVKDVEVSVVKPVKVRTAKSRTGKGKASKSQAGKSKTAKSKSGKSKKK